MVLLSSQWWTSNSGDDGSDGEGSWGIRVTGCVLSQGSPTLLLSNQGFLVYCTPLTGFSWKGAMSGGSVALSFIRCPPVRVHDRGSPSGAHHTRLPLLVYKVCMYHTHDMFHPRFLAVGAVVIDVCICFV